MKDKLNDMQDCGVVVRSDGPRNFRKPGQTIIV
jgi:hypothetical protein